jgi:hypothetical protein
MFKAAKSGFRSLTRDWQAPGSTYAHPKRMPMLRPAIAEERWEVPVVNLTAAALTPKVRYKFIFHFPSIYDSDSLGVPACYERLVAAGDLR